jgi:hypothetical protein
MTHIIQMPSDQVLPKILERNDGLWDRAGCGTARRNSTVPSWWLTTPMPADADECPIAGQ